MGGGMTSVVDGTGSGRRGEAMWNVRARFHGNVGVDAARAPDFVSRFRGGARAVSLTRDSRFGGNLGAERVPEGVTRLRGSVWAASRASQAGLTFPRKRLEPARDVADGGFTFPRKRQQRAGCAAAVSSRAGAGVRRA
jgi:hypothetical protein